MLVCFLSAQHYNITFALEASIPDTHQSSLFEDALLSEGRGSGCGRCSDAGSLGRQLLVGGSNGSGGSWTSARGLGTNLSL